MIKESTMRIFGVVAFALFLGAGMTSSMAQTDQDPPKELVQYVRDAKQQGLKESSIKQNAVAIGWPASTVDSAIAYAKQQETKDKIAALAGEPAAGGNTSKPLPSSSSQAAAFNLPVTAPAPADTAEVAKGRPASDAYMIGAGDNLQISVWREPDASVPSVVVRPDGNIAIPLLKEVQVAGMTTTEAEKVITERLSKFINSPDVTVVVTAINSKKVYVVGAARKEGPIPYTYRMSVMQAISEAGGLNDYAKRKKIYVLRTENGKDYRLLFNYNEVIKGEKMEQNIQLLPGDTLVIPH